jgi:putative Holliday junction resolvase
VSPAGRILGIDLGERRIGLALTDDPDSAPRAHSTIRRGRASADDARRLAGIIAAESVAEIIVGLPLEASGVEGDQARRTREWVDAVSPALTVPMAYRDERLSSHLAEQRLGPMPRGRSGGPPTPHQREEYRARVDREAAAIILEDELSARRGRRTGTRTGGTGAPTGSIT